MSEATGLNIAVVGATGQVGSVMRRLLEEREFPVKSIRFFASSRSAGTTLPFRGEDIVVEDVATADVSGIDMITWNADGKISAFKVMVRPLKAIQLIHQQMAAMLEAQKAKAG